MNTETSKLVDSFLQIARIALTGRPQDIQLAIHRATKRLKDAYPELTDSLFTLLQESPTQTTPLRKHKETPLPVDLDSRLQLLRLDNDLLDHEPVLAQEIRQSLMQVLAERTNPFALSKHGLVPTKSLLFTGPPGVGKTMAAKWIAHQLQKPLLILDLTAVMSSFLGRTGNNIRFVLDYAKNTDCVLLLDELDAIAKRRDDSSEIGELKRLVTVLLQEIDDWPPSGLLIAATNHPDLLDPAVWRRFEIIVDFMNPTKSQIQQQVTTLLLEHTDQAKMWGVILSYVFFGKSFSDIERTIRLIRKSAALSNTSLEDKLIEHISTGGKIAHEEKVELACVLTANKIVTQRKASEITGVARETIRKNIIKQ